MAKYDSGEMHVKRGGRKNKKELFIYIHLQGLNTRLPISFKPNRTDRTLMKTGIREHACAHNYC